MNPSVWYVSFHGGEGAHCFNNIGVYSLGGQRLRKALDKHSLRDGINLRELRWFGFGPDGNLYVVNAYKDYSQVLRFHGSLNANGQHEFLDVFVQYHKHHNAGLLHPFQVAFDSLGNLYVANQDTNSVTRYHGPSSDESLRGAPMPLPDWIEDPLLGQCHPGSFVLSSRQHPEGLEVVRGTAFDSRGDFYVADRDAGCVKKCDGRSGRILQSIGKRQMSKPIHLLLDSVRDELYVGDRGTDSILRCNLMTGQVSAFIESKSGGLANPGGIALGPDGFLYVASRSTKQVLRYRADSGAPDHRPFLDGLEDFPEFIHLMNVA